MKRTIYSSADFAWIDWSAEDILALVPYLLDDQKNNCAAIKNIPPNERTFINTVYALESAGYSADSKIRSINLLLAVSPSQEIREAAKEAIERFEKESVEIYYDEGLYRALEEYAEKREELAGPDKKLFDDLMRDYRRMGFHLPKDKQDIFKKNLKAMAELSLAFEKNINDYQDYILVAENELEGLDENYLKMLRKADDGRYMVSLDYPEYIPFIENAKNAAKRKELIDKNLQKGGAGNMELLKDIVKLRDKNAKLLGYKTHADFRVEVRMAKTIERVSSFLRDLAERMRPLIKEEFEKLASFKCEQGGEEEAALDYYDIPYLIKQLMKKEFSIDDEHIREYFPLPKVRKELFDLYGTLFSISFEKLPDFPVWHNDVELWSVSDKDGETLGYFFLDLFPREGKFTHAQIQGIVRGRRTSPDPESPYISPVCAMVANFKKPAADLPSLLGRNEVSAFFHEFGHIIHHLLTAAPYASQAGTSVVWDFVEAPSQMLENWLWDKEVVQSLSGHYKTGEPLPDETFQNMLRAKNYMIGYRMTRQVVLSLFDLLLHTRETEMITGSDIARLYSDIFLEYIGIAAPQGNIFPAGFGHLVGYDAGYYGYLWSEVYSADMFTRFKKEGLWNPVTGGEYRKWILEKGSSMEEIELVRGFLGRDPKSDAFLEDVGLGK